MSKKILLFLVVLLVFAFSGITCAADNPFKGLTQDQVVQKYFEGRQLELIEGFWLDDYRDPIIIIKANLINSSIKENKNNFDYFMVKYSTSSDTKISGVRKTQYSSCFEFEGLKYRLLRFVSTNSLQLRCSSYYGTSLYQYYTRIYPSEIK